MKRAIYSIFAHVALFVILTGTLMAVSVGRRIRRALGRGHPGRPFGAMRLLLTGTFYNENWFRSHILPLSAAQSIYHIDVITDRPLFDVPKVRYLCPSPLLLRLLGRTGARAWLVLTTARRERPDLLMGYHIMPNTLLCLVAANLFGGISLYQMTGGPTQIIGGGVGSENALLCLLRRHSRCLESLMFQVVRQIDILVVRGARAVKFVQDHRLGRQIVVVSGSVDTERAQLNGTVKKYDLVVVARHIKEKQLNLLLDLVAELRRRRPGVRAALVGDGPLTPSLRDRARELEIEDNVDFLGKLRSVDEVLAGSRVFVLTSQTEGLSIAMIEAMVAGLPVVVPDIGELGELVIPSENGAFIRPERVSETADTVEALLQDPEGLARMSAASRRRAVECNSVSAIAKKWDRCFSGLTRGGQ